MLLLEGTHLLEEALSTNYLPKEIFATPSWLEKYSDIVDSLSEEIKIYQLTDSILGSALTTVNPDGVASLFPIAGLPLPPKSPEFVLALDRLQDPGNLGSLFRTGLAADLDVIWISSGVHPLNPKVIRASSGSLLRLPYERFGKTEVDGIELLVKKLISAHQKGFQVISSSVPRKDISKKVVPYWEIEWSKPSVLVLGNEGSGVHQEIQNCCTHFVTLPHNPIVESLNVAAASVPMLLERRRAKMVSDIH